MAHWLLYVSLWNTLTILFVWWLVKVFVFTICREHSDALAKLQDKDFLVCPSRLFLKTFVCLIVWLPIISGVFSIRLNAITGLTWNTPRNPVFTCRIFLCLFTILDILRSVSLYVINSGILWLVSFFFVNSSFHSILSTLLKCSFRTSSSYLLSKNFCTTIARFL